MGSWIAHSETNKTKERFFIKSLARGIEVLEVLAEKREPLTLSQISEALHMHKTTVSRFCYTLSELKLIYSDREKRYSLTPKILTLGYPLIFGMEWRQIAGHYLDTLSAEIDETVNLSVLDGPNIQFVYRIPKRKFVPFDIRLGSKLPAYCTSMGKVLLAMGQPEVVKPILQKLTFHPFTPYTITNQRAFLKELDGIRKKGYAINKQEMVIGITGVAAPILARNGHAIAAINIGDLDVQKCSQQRLERELTPVIIKTSRDITETLIKMNQMPEVLKLNIYSENANRV